MKHDAEPQHHRADANACAARVLAQALLAPTAQQATPSACERHVVAAPGSRHTPLLLALASEPCVRLHMVLDERAAGFLALGLAKRTGQATILCCTSGSAGAHLLPAIVEASQSCVPLIVLTADRPQELHACGAPQTMPQAQLYAGFVHHQAQLPVPQAPASSLILGAWRLEGARARAVAERLRPGPVHLNLPFREPLWVKPAPQAGLHDGLYIKPPIQVCTGEAGIDAAASHWLCDIIQNAQRGLIVVGPLPPDDASRQDAAAIMALAVHLGWPCVVDGCSQLRLGEANGVRITTADALLRQPAFTKDLAGPDVIVRFGQLPTSKALWTWLGRVGALSDVTTLLVDAHAAWHDPAHVGDALVVARPEVVCRQWTNAIQANKGRLYNAAFCAHWQRGQTLAHEALIERLNRADDGQKAPTEAFVAHALCQALPDNALLHVASSMPIRDVESFAQALKTQVRRNMGPRLCCSRGVNGIDGTLATLLGLALAGSEGLVVGLMGDLAFLHDVASLQLARQLQAPCVAIVVNNQGGDIFTQLPIAALKAQDLPQHKAAVDNPFDAYFRTPQKADMEALCRAAHVGFCQVTTCEAFRQALQSCGIATCGTSVQRQAGLQVIEVVIAVDASRQARTQLHEAVAQALRSL